MARSDVGDIYVEMLVGTLVALVGILFSVNIVGFAAECAKLDRVASEAARTSVLQTVSGGDVDAMMGYGAKGGRHYVTISSRTVAGVVVDYQAVTCTLHYVPWPAPNVGTVDVFGMGFKVPTEMKHSVTFVIDRFSPSIFFGG